MIGRTRVFLPKLGLIKKNMLPGVLLGPSNRRWGTATWLAACMICILRHLRIVPGRSSRLSEFEGQWCEAWSTFLTTESGQPSRNKRENSGFEKREISKKGDGKRNQLWPGTCSISLLSYRTGNYWRLGKLIFAQVQLFCSIHSIRLLRLKEPKTEEERGNWKVGYGSPVHCS